VDGVPSGSGLGVGLTVGFGVGVPGGATDGLCGVMDGLDGQAAAAADGPPLPCAAPAAAIAGRGGFT
jgi:hypothetical protein